MNRSLPRFSLLPLLALVQACGGGPSETQSPGSSEKPFTVRFSPQVGEQALRCDASYSGVGSPGSSIQLLDFKLYVRDVTLVRANGERHPLVLDQDGTWQRDALALLDFEDGTGTCSAGSPETRGEVVGRAPDFQDYTGLEFKIGVPPELNHLDGATALAPLNDPSMWWSWKSGYKFMRLDVRTPKNAAFLFHLGASGCTGNVAEGFSCTGSNAPVIALTGFDPERDEVVLDVASLYANTDLDHAIDNTTDFISGCMSSPTDPECPPLLAPLGLAADGTAQSVPVTFFRVREP